MKKNPILALVGDSGVGKTTLLVELLKRNPAKLFPLVVLTNREKRGPEDDIFCEFVDAEFIKSKRDRGELIQYLAYAGSVYGLSKESIESTLSKGVGVQAFVESGINDLRKHGYGVISVKVVSDMKIYRDEKRLVEDKKRATTAINYELILENSFKEGGLEKAVEALISLLVKDQI